MMVLRLSCLVLIAILTRSVAAQQEAINKALELTEAIARDDARAVQKLFGADEAIAAADVHAISRESFGEQRPILRVVGFRRPERRAVKARVFCRESYQSTMTIPVELIEQDKLIIRLTVGKREQVEPQGQEQGRETDDFKMAYKNALLADMLLEEPGKRRGTSLPVYPIEGEQLRKECKRDNIAVQDVKSSDTAVIAVRMLAETPTSILRVTADMTAGGRPVRWRSGDFPEDHIAEWRTDRGERVSDILLEEVRVRLSILEREGLSRFRSLRPYNVDDRDYFDARQTRTAIAAVKRSTLAAFTGTTLAPMRAWLTAELQTLGEPQMQQVAIADGGPAETRAVFVAEAVRDIQLAWQDMIDKVRSVRDMSPDVTITSAPEEAGFTLRIAAEPDKIGTTNQTLKNVYRGLYTLEIGKAEHKPGTYRVDLVNDSRSRVVCTLTPVAAEGPSFCRQQ